MNSLKPRVFAIGCMLLSFSPHALAAALALPFGQVQTGSIITATQNNTYTFSVSANDVVDFTMSTTGNLIPKMRLYNSMGTLLAQAFPMFNGGCYGASTTELNTFTFTASGTYTLLVGDCQDANTGNYALYAQRTNNPALAAVLPFSQVKNGSISSAAQRNSYTISANANDVLDFTMTTLNGANLIPRIRLYNPAGTLLTQAFPTFNGGCYGAPSVELNNVTIPATGIYTVLAGDCLDTYTGSYDLSVQCFGVCTGPAPSTALGFFPIVPCRAVDTRVSQNKTGAFGPPALTSGGIRDFPLTSGSCNLPGSAAAFSLNLTVVPPAPEPYLSAWPTGQPYPNVSTLNSTDASTLANAAIVPSGTNGSITILSGGVTDLIIDTNGYFAPPNGSELAFYQVAPCRIADTRTSQPFTGMFGPPSLVSGEERDFPIQLSSCHIPASAEAYSLNVTVVPQGPLPYLSAWPTGQPYPNVSTLNSNDGSVIANAAIVPAGSASGSIRVLPGGNSDLILDVNGYFGPSGGQNALHFYALTPCRIADTRASQGFGGAFGPPSLNSSMTRDFPILSSGCNIPPDAQVYSLNITAVPQGPLPYLSIWPAGQPYPNVSTLNSPKGTTLANAAIVPAGSPGGGVTVLAGSATDIIIDINGYFAP